MYIARHGQIQRMFVYTSRGGESECHVDDDDGDDVYDNDDDVMMMMWSVALHALFPS